MSSYGDLVDELSVGPLTIQVKYDCLRRDLYDIRLGAPFPPGLGAAVFGEREDRALYVIDVPGVHRVTVATAAGRVVVMPKLSTTRAGQREAALALAARIAAFVSGAGTR